VRFQADGPIATLVGSGRLPALGPCATELPAHRGGSEDVIKTCRQGRAYRSVIELDRLGFHDTGFVRRLDLLERSGGLGRGVRAGRSGPAPRGDREPASLSGRSGTLILYDS
jgi:hypothetical protein